MKIRKRAAWALSSLLLAAAVLLRIFSTVRRRQGSTLEEDCEKTSEANEVHSLTGRHLDKYRVTEVGRSVIVTEGIQHFPDFLFKYLEHRLAPEWGVRQLKLSIGEQHPAVKWRNIYAAAQRRDADGLIHIKSGAGFAWVRLAYDLFLIERNSELQKVLIRRLRDPGHFQGARFEAAVSAMMLAAGYDLRYIESRGPGGKRPEFIATHRASGHKLAVEAKSRHRPGIMGFRGLRSDPGQLDIDRLLRDALLKDPKEPLLIFLEINSPRVLAEGKHLTDLRELDSAWLRQQSLSWSKGFPAIGVVFYNDASPWFLEGEIAEGTSYVSAFAKGTDGHRHGFDARPLLRSILEGCAQRLNIPQDIPTNRSHHE